MPTLRGREATHFSDCCRQLAIALQEVSVDIIGRINPTEVPQQQKRAAHHM